MRAPAMLIESAFVACRAGLLVSVTLTVKFEVPPVVGVPLITPVPDRVRPAGSVPVAMDQAYGGVPPAAANV